MKKWIAAALALLVFGGFVPLAPVLAANGPTAGETGNGEPSKQTDNAAPDTPANPVMVIAPQFSYAFPFSEGLAAVVIDDKIGFIDRSGAFVIEPAFDGRQASAMESGLYVFREGRALFRQNGKYGFLDKKGNIAVEAAYDRAFPFSEGLAAVVRGDRLGYIDRNGNVVIPLRYHYDPRETENPSFQNGLAKVAVKSGNAVLYGFIDKDGREAIPPQDWYVEPFSDGLALVRDSSGGRISWFFIDPSGEKKLLLDTRYDRVYSFYSGLARVEKDGKIGYIDKNGNEVVPPRYAFALNFSEGRGLAKIGTNYVLVGTDGRESAPLSYSYIEKFSNGLAMAEQVKLDFSGGSLNRERKTGYIDPSGREVIAPQFERGQGFSEGLAAVMIGGQWGYIARPDRELPSAWARAEMAEAAYLGLIPDGMDADYRKTVTRAEFAKLAVHLLAAALDKPIGQIVKERGVSVKPDAFRDTRDEAVLAAHALGIVSGRGGGLFDPDGAVNRQEAALMLANVARLIGAEPDGQAAGFTDAADIAPWAMEAVRTVSAIRDRVRDVPVLAGVGQGRFGPGETFERQQALISAKRLFRAQPAGE